jgi:orotate phosphoribosyltransferase
VTVGRDAGTDCFRPPTGTAVAVGSINDCKEEPVTGADSEREELARLVRELGVVHGRVTLASGAEAEYYVDLRRVTLHHRAAPLIGHVLLDHLEEAGLGTAEVDAVGGLTLGADPIATALLHAAASRGQDLDAFVVRKAAKAHGMQRQIEGPDIAGRKVVVLEDTTTTGGSPITAIEAARAAGAEVLACATIVDRATGAGEKIEALGVPYHYLYDLADLSLA